MELTFQLSGAAGGTSNVALTGVLRPVSVLGGLFILGLAGLWMRDARSAQETLLWWGLALGGMLLVAPIVWDHYLTTLIPLIVGIAASLGSAWPGLLSIGLTTAAYGGGFAIAWLPALGLALALVTRRHG